MSVTAWAETDGIIRPMHFDRIRAAFITGSGQAHEIFKPDIRASSQLRSRLIHHPSSFFVRVASIAMFSNE